MPVPKPRGSSERVDYVIVKRSNEEVVRVRTTESMLSTRGDSAAFARLGRRDDDDDDNEDDGGNQASTPTSTIIATQSVSQAQQTSEISGTPPPPPPPPPPRGGGISPTTEHLLIAAGSIGATIIVVMIIMAYHTMRKRGLTVREVMHYGKYRMTRRDPPPPPPKTWNTTQTYGNDFGASKSGTITSPARAMSINRSASSSSQRPLMTMQSSESFNARPETSNNSASPMVQQSFLLSPAPPGPHRRNHSETPSSPVLPLQTQQPSISTRDTRSMSVGSELKYPDPPIERALSPLPPPPTFKQFLNNRPSASKKPEGGAMISRFSWTNSNAPQTPHDPNRDTKAFMLGRDSFMTQRSSVPRFRTVDSWVNQQTNRIEEQKLKEHYRLTQTSTVFSGDDDRGAMPDIPEVPSQKPVAAPVGPSPLSITTTSKPLSPPPPPSGGLPGKNIKHERHDTRTTVETAPIFRQHPGTEVRFSTRSAVPSEILDMGRKNNVLS